MVDLEATLGDALLREEAEVPPAATTVRAVAEARRRGDLSLDELRRYAFADPAVAAELIGAAGDGRGAGAVSSLPAAEALLGGAALIEIVGTVAGRAPGPVDGGPLAAPRRRAWRSAVLSAMLCRDLARDRGVAPEEAYACGLLHDVGRLAALAALERLAGGRAGTGVPLPRWERFAERWHVALGVAVAERHRLPRPIFEAIAFHHPERTRLASPPPLLQVVRSVDALVAALLAGSDPAGAVEAAGLAGPEAARLARAVERIQDHVAALEQRAGEAASADPLAAPGPALRESKGAGLRLRLAGREYAAVGFARHQLLVAGPAPLGQGALLEVEVLDRRCAPFHARVLVGWEGDGGFGAILLPLALSGPSLAALGGLAAGAEA